MKSITDSMTPWLLASAWANDGPRLHQMDLSPGALLKHHTLHVHAGAVTSEQSATRRRPNQTFFLKPSKIKQQHPKSLSFARFIYIYITPRIQQTPPSRLFKQQSFSAPSHPSPLLWPPLLSPGRSVRGTLGRCLIAPWSSRPKRAANPPESPARRRRFLRGLWNFKARDWTGLLFQRILKIFKQQQ